jgi:hypothetical protein
MKFVLIGLGWLLLAIVVGLSGLLRQLRPPVPQLVLLSLTAALLFAWRTRRGFRSWIDALDLRALVALHLTRFVGLYFLFLYRKGELPFAFAVPAGCGDVLVAILACLLLAYGKNLVLKRRSLLIWNVLGLTDILFVVTDAARQTLVSPVSMTALLRLPLSLLVTFFVPLIIASHIFIFSRLRKA